VTPSLVELRPWRRDDAPALVDAWHTPDIVAGSRPPEERTLAAAERWIDGAADREHRRIAIDRVIDAGGVCVGEVGASSIDDRRGAALVGWWIAAEHRRRGHATTAVGLLAELLFCDFDLRTLVAEIADDNVASRRAAATVGFRPLGPGSYVLRRPDVSGSSSVPADR